MAKEKESVNPFYVLVVIVGVAFVVTAFVYGTMAYRAVAPRAAEQDASHPLMTLVDRFGVETLGVEIGLLAAATFGAMWLDGVRTRGNEAAEHDSTPGSRPS